MNAPVLQLNPEDQEFIRKHLKEEPAKLALKFHHHPHKKQLVAQIKARQQIRKKLPEWYQNPELLFPPGLPLEQASSEDTARLKASLISGNHLLDITGGLGVDSWYLSRSFKQATYVEKDPELAAYAAFNFKVLNAVIQVKCADGTEQLKTSEADVIYADPYRRDDQKQKLTSLKDYQPDVTKLIDDLTQNGKTALIKTSPMLDISQGIKELREVSEVWVISVRNECKEVVFLLTADCKKPPLIRSFNIKKGQTEKFEHPITTIPPPALLDPMTFLYEPNASILKAGLQDAVAAEYGLGKLHPNSHFYTSDKREMDFPGRAFKVVEIHKAWDKKLRGGKFNVISRNFPAKANQIENKLKLAPDKTAFLLATRLQNENLKFIRTEKLS